MVSSCLGTLAKVLFWVVSSTAGFLKLAGEKEIKRTQSNSTVYCPDPFFCWSLQTRRVQTQNLASQFWAQGLLLSSWARAGERCRGRGFRLQTRQAPKLAGGISASWGQDLGCAGPGDVVTILLPGDLEGWDPPRAFSE